VVGAAADKMMMMMTAGVVWVILVMWAVKRRHWIIRNK